MGGKFVGLFTIDEVRDDKYVVFVGIGTGLAPYMSMLRTNLVCGGKRHFTVLHGARHSWDLGYRSELETLERMCPNFGYIPSISRPQEEAEDGRGAARKSTSKQDLWRRQPLKATWDFHPSPANDDVFVCGNPEMAESTLAALAREGFREHTRRHPGNVHVERIGSLSQRMPYFLKSA